MTIEPRLEDFERLTDDFAMGSSKLASRKETLSITDARDLSWMDDGDFLARLWARFGAPSGARGFSYVFRHQPTGIVFTAYSGASGPSYGGGRVDAGALVPMTFMEAHAAMRARAGQGAPTGFHEVLAAFEALLAQTPLLDCERIAKSEDGLYRFGARGGKSFSQKLTSDEAILVWLADAEAADREPLRTGETEALELARRGWLADLAKTEHMLEQLAPDRRAQLAAMMQGGLNEDMGVLGLDTPEHRARLRAIAR